MCYYNGFKVSKTDYITLLGIEKDLRHYNINKHVQSGFDYGNYPIAKPVPVEKDWEIVEAHWEYIPFWINNMEELKQYRQGIDPKTGKRSQPIPWLNFKGETVVESKMFRQSALSRRCLVLSTHFFESRHIQIMGKRGTLLKTPEIFPYVIELKDQELFYMAGIWTPWTDKTTGETMETFALGTTEANSFMRQIHNSKNRMPTILTGSLADEWISPGLSEKRITELASYQIPSNQLQAHLIDKNFKSSFDPKAPFDYGDIVPSLQYEN